MASLTAQDKFGKISKEGMVNEIVSRFKGHPNFIITSYMGSSVSDLEQLRKNLKKNWRIATDMSLHI